MSSAWRSVLFWASLPVVLPQAAWVRLTAPRVDGAAGHNNGVIGRGTERRLLVYGDSIAAGVGAKTFPNALAGRVADALAERLECRILWESRGYIGANVQRLLVLLDTEPFDEPPDFVVLSVGVNDVTSLTRLERWSMSLQRLLRHIDQECGSPVIALAGIPDMARFPLLPQPLRSILGLRSRQLDAAGRAVAGSFDNVTHVPVEFELRPDTFSDDGYHPSETSYGEFAGTLAGALVSLDRRNRT